MKRVFFIPKLIRLLWQQREHCERAQSYNSFRQGRIRDRAAIKSLILCTHFFTRQHIPPTTNFHKLVDSVVACGCDDLKHFLENAGRNAMYTSHIAVVEFVEALGTWVEESLLKWL